MPIWRIESGWFLLLAVCLLVIPLEWLAAMALAAGIHELFHVLAAKALGSKILGISMDWSGIRMDLSPLLLREELLVALAGPVGSFLLLIIAKWYPQLAVCGLVQGMFNFLPVWPLDGGRVLRGLFPGQERLYRIIEWITVLTLLAMGFWLWKCVDLGIGPLCLAAIAAGKVFVRKIPCIADELGVQ